MSRIRQMHAEWVVLLPLLGGVIAGMIALSARSTVSSGGHPLPAAEDRAASPVSGDHQPLRRPG